MKLNSVLLCITFVAYAGMAWGQECLVTTFPVSFGNYEPFLDAPLDATGRVTIVCDDVSPFTVKLDKGHNPEGGPNLRAMGATATNDSLQYNLFTDSARLKIWGDGTGNTFVNTGTANRVQVPFIIYGRIPARQNVPVESYSDQVNVIVEW